LIESPARQTISNDELELLGHLIGDGCTLPSHVTQYITREQDLAYCGSTLYKHKLSRERAACVAQIVSSYALALLAQSDVYWDQIVAVEPDGEADVYDLTVPGLQSFESNGLIVHNSIEQDSDVVMFIYREEIYKPETEKQNIAEIIIGKQRNGPIGSVELVFLKQLTRFEDKYREQG
jgi:replicative DNA helicase